MKQDLTRHKTIYDISVLLGGESITFPSDTPYSRDLMLTIKDNGICNVSKLILSAHAGTHLDFPLHFVPDGKSIDDYSVHDFILPTQVVHIDDKESINPPELEKIDIKEGDAILFKTENSINDRCRKGVFSEKFVYLSAEGAAFCVTKKVSLVGIDYVSIDRFGDVTSPAHHILLGNNILILEGINLKEIAPGRYTLFCLPLKIRGGEASPVRAMLMSQ